jgi:hypothetical protein
MSGNYLSLGPISLPCRAVSYHDQARIDVRGAQWGLAGLQANTPASGSAQGVYS